MTDDRAAMPVAARLCAAAAAAALGALLPVAMVIANKSAPAALGAAALSATFSALLAGFGPTLRARYGMLLRRPATLLALAFTLLALASLGWSIDPAQSRRGLIEALPGLVFAFMTAAAWPLVAARRDVGWLVGGLVGAGALIVLERLDGMALHGLLGARGEAWDLKRSAIPPVLLLWPALAATLARRRHGLAALLSGAAAAGIVASHSGAPGFALVTAAALALLSLRAPKIALSLVAGALVLLLALAPWTGTLVGRALPARVTAALAEEHAAHRLRIWSAFERRVGERWLLGHGFDASFKVFQAPRPDGSVPDADNADMRDNHPHDVFLELWVELGLLGAGAAAGLGGWVLVGLASSRPGPPDHGHDAARRPAPAFRRPGLAPRLGLLVSVVGIGLVGLSAWQPWWLATIAASLLWLDVLETGPAPDTGAGQG